MYIHLPSQNKFHGALAVEIGMGKVNTYMILFLLRIGNRVELDNGNKIH